MRMIGNLDCNKAADDRDPNKRGFFFFLFFFVSCFLFLTFCSINVSIFYLYLSTVATYRLEFTCCFFSFFFLSGKLAQYYSAKVLSSPVVGIANGDDGSGRLLLGAKSSTNARNS